MKNYFRITRKLKIAQCSKSCLKRKKVAEQLVESSTGAHPGGHQHGDRKPTETSATE